MRNQEPHLPSFTLALTQPNYAEHQSTHRVFLPRYHPYPRDPSSRHPREDYLMKTIDERDETYENSASVDIYPHIPTFIDMHPQERALAENLHRALDNTADNADLKVWRPMRFSSLVIVLAFSLVRRLGNLRMADKLTIEPGDEREIVCENANY